MSYRLTLAEAETSLRKAARACGLDWGIAEEAGKAARWLAAFDLPGPELMLAHLLQLREVPYATYIPRVNEAIWQAEGGLLCPIITGAALADRAAQMLLGHEFKLGRTAYPLLLAATVGQAARRDRSVFTTHWGEVRVSCFENGLDIAGNTDDLRLTEVATVHCAQDELERPSQLPSTRAYAIDQEIFAKIEALALQTYVPATTASRAGAGAGLTDND